jgi:ornithine--oxo-acid transaminase
MTRSAAQYIAAEDTHIAPIHHPFPVVIATAAGAWVTDVEGRR